MDAPTMVAAADRKVGDVIPAGTPGYVTAREGTGVDRSPDSTPARAVVESIQPAGAGCSFQVAVIRYLDGDTAPAVIPPGMGFFLVPTPTGVDVVISSEGECPLRHYLSLVGTASCLVYDEGLAVAGCLTYKVPAAIIRAALSEMARRPIRHSGSRFVRGAVLADLELRQRADEASCEFHNSRPGGWDAVYETVYRWGA